MLGKIPTCIGTKVPPSRSVLKQSIERPTRI